MVSPRAARGGRRGESRERTDTRVRAIFKLPVTEPGSMPNTTGASEANTSSHSQEQSYRIHFISTGPNRAIAFLLQFISAHRFLFYYSLSIHVAQRMVGVVRGVM